MKSHSRSPSRSGWCRQACTRQQRSWPGRSWPRRRGRGNAWSSGGCWLFWKFTSVMGFSPDVFLSSCKQWLQLTIKDAAGLARRVDQTVIVSRSPVMQPWQSEDKIKVTGHLRRQTSYLDLESFIRPCTQLRSTGCMRKWCNRMRWKRKQGHKVAGPALTNLLSAWCPVHVRRIWCNRVRCEPTSMDIVNNMWDQIELKATLYWKIPRKIFLHLLLVESRYLRKGGSQQTHLGCSDAPCLGHFGPFRQLQCWANSVEAPLPAQLLRLVGLNFESLVLCKV